MYLPVDTDELVITQRFHARNHKGVDLRSVDLETYDKLDIILPEDAEVLRRGVDGFGNDFLVVQPTNDFMSELKFIHVTFDSLFEVGEMLEAGTVLGKTQIVDEIGRGNSLAHHLHFETWRKGTPINPMRYFDEYHTPYRFK